MKKILKLQCDTCDRKIDKIIDLKRYDTDKCTITLGCAGRLSPIEYKSTADITVATKAGVLDWIPRNLPISKYQELKSETFISLSSGVSNQLTLVVKSEDFGPGSFIRVPINLKGDVPKPFRQYTFIMDKPFISISGVESGQEKKTLRFNKPDESFDIVEVYVNGVKREFGEDLNQFKFYSGNVESRIPPNTIMFNSRIVPNGAAQVDVIVSKYVKAVTKKLTFTRNSSALNLDGSWNNILFVDKFRHGPNVWERLLTFTCDLSFLDIPLNSIFTVGPVIEISSINSVAPISDAFLLLSNPPYTEIDRKHNLVVPLSTISDRDYFKYYIENEKRAVKVISTAAQEVFPLLKTPPESKISGINLIKTAIKGSQDATRFDSTTIVGPDE